MAREMWARKASDQVTIRLLLGDLTDENVDAIVNAANSRLAHGGGVAGAIVRKGGYVIQEESNRVAPVEVGHCAMTSAGSLPARHVIHAVGPQWGEGNEDATLRSAVENSLALADAHRLATVSLPAISSGIFGFPKDRCARILLATAREFAARHPETSLREIRFCIIDSETAQVFLREFETAWPA